MSLTVQARRVAALFLAACVMACASAPHSQSAAAQDAPIPLRGTLAP